MEGILRSTAEESLICAAVEAESLYLRHDDPKEPMEPVQLTPFIKAGLLATCQIESAEEEQLYVDYAGDLDDGEAMSIALALTRGHCLATDDRKARRLFKEAVNDPNRLISTPKLIRHWHNISEVSSDKLEALLLRVESKACYQPSPSDPDFQWWARSCQRMAT
jgi:hypothetical protein